MGVSAAIAVAVAGAGTAYYQGEKAADAQDKAMKQAKEQAAAQAKSADEAMNAANAKKPNTRQILDANTLAGKGGVSGTMLTGPQGVDPASLTLGKNTLLGS